MTTNLQGGCPCKGFCPLKRTQLAFSSDRSHQPSRLTRTCIPESDTSWTCSRRVPERMTRLVNLHSAVNTACQTCEADMNLVASAKYQDLMYPRMVKNTFKLNCLCCNLNVRSSIDRYGPLVALHTKIDQYGTVRHCFWGGGFSRHRRPLLKRLAIPLIVNTL